ncbi:hypothetical protein Daus18300_003225 [Diaporthe australafricana]|uniref:Uncharacterized protein n=1 Tax=Diaporthe australafricana TaxID=127596 RepID=A0ABR3XHJ8_9PEZI
MSDEKLVSHLNISDDPTVSGPVTPDPFIPNDANIFPKFIHNIDRSCWELWQFDAVSAEDDTAVSFSFYRAPGNLEKGGFHVDINAIWPDGSKWATTLLFEESTVTSGGQPDIVFNHENQEASFQNVTTGIWRSTASKTSASFNIANDLSIATVRLDCPSRVTGTVHLTALRARGSSSSSNSTGADGRLPATEEEALLAPSIYYLFPMGPATAAIDLAFTEGPNGESGAALKQIVARPGDGARGSIVRGWSVLSFPQMLSDAYYLNAAVGPYMLQLIRIESAASAGGQPHTLTRLYRDNKLVFAAQDVSHATAGSGGEPRGNAVVVTKVMAGDPGPEGIAAAFRDKNIGRSIELIEKDGAARGRRWLFQVRHRRAWWSEPTSALGVAGPGKSGFIETVFGGLEGEEPFQGPGLAGQLQI